MKFGTLTAAAAAVTLAVAPAVAADRVSAPVDESSELGGGSTAVIGILAVAAIAAAIYVAVDDDEDPISP